MTPHQAYRKSLEAGKRLPELEDIIMTDSCFSYRYAQNVIKDRWIEAEDIIMTHVYYSCCYSLFVIGGKLPYKMHNMMILHAIKDPDNWCAKRYFKSVN